MSGCSAAEYWGDSQRRAPCQLRALDALRGALRTSPFLLSAVSPTFQMLRRGEPGRQAPQGRAGEGEGSGLLQGVSELEECGGLGRAVCKVSSRVDGFFPDSPHTSALTADL